MSPTLAVAHVWADKVRTFKTVNNNQFLIIIELLKLHLNTLTTAAISDFAGDMANL